jgi:hypothetical protein
LQIWKEFWLSGDITLKKASPSKNIGIFSTVIERDLSNITTINKELKSTKRKEKINIVKKIA